MTKKIKIMSYGLIATLVAIAFVAGISLSTSLRYDFKTLSNDTYKLTDFKGDVVIVNYFAEWCAPCLREIPELNEFYHQKSDNVHIFAVSYDNLTEHKLQQIADKYQIEFPLITEVKQPFPFERPQFLPATFIIKPNGELAGQLLGEQTLTGLNEAVQAVQ